MVKLLLILLMSTAGCVAPSEAETQRIDRESERVPDTVIDKETDIHDSPSVQASPCNCDHTIIAEQLDNLTARIEFLEAENAAMKAANRAPEYRIVMYGADWCGPCHALKRTLDNAGIKYDYIDTTADESEAWRNLGVTVFPTMFLVEDNVIQTGRKVVGSVSAATVRKAFPEAFK